MKAPMKHTMYRRGALLRGGKAKGPSKAKPVPRAAPSRGARSGGEPVKGKVTVLGKKKRGFRRVLRRLAKKRGIGTKRRHMTGKEFAAYRASMQKKKKDNPGHY